MIAIPTGQQYATNVPQTNLTAGINGVQTSFGVASLSSWPAPPYTAILDIGTSIQEPIDVITVAGNTITLCTRSIDGTSPFSHPNATFTHGDIGRDFREARSHIDSAGPLDVSSEAVHGLTNTAGNVVMGTKEVQTLSNKTLQAAVIDTTVPAGVPAGKLGVYTNAGVLSVIDNAGTISAVTPPMLGPDVNKFLAWTYDPVIATSSMAPALGVIRLSKITTHTPIVVSNIVVFFNSNGTTLTAGQNFMGIYNSAGSRVAVSADQTTTWGSAGPGPLSTAVGPVTLEPGDYFIAMLANGAGAPSFISCVNSGTVANMGLAAPFRTGAFGTSQTSLPGSITMASVASAGFMPVFGLT